MHFQKYQGTCERGLNFYNIYTVTIVIHKSRYLIGTIGIAKFGPKKGPDFAE